MALIREELVELSVLRAITLGLPDYGYTINADPSLGDVYVREAFPSPEERQAELKQNTLAFGFNIDDGGMPAEMGSTLTTYSHTLMCWTFALEPRFGRRLAHTIKHIARRNSDHIQLLDFNDPSEPQVDALIVLKTQVAHQLNQSPRPWDQYVWSTAIVVRDVAYPS
ncbi:MAG: hypothetical protein M3Y33_17635 [Actinomycetota bacterium]|nr:hypothetical protein [Actinomycetota bacterium]